MMWKNIPTSNISQKYYLAICPVMNNEKKAKVPQFKKKADNQILIPPLQSPKRRKWVNY